jgi:hypothetical protein
MLIEPENFPKRLALSLEYEGNRYHGWQSQKDEPLAVQTFVERALSKIANEPVKVVCSGRTDAGVHASSQVCHFETRAVRESYNWVMFPFLGYVKSIHAFMRGLAQRLGSTFILFGVCRFVVLYFGTRLCLRVGLWMLHEWLKQVKS